MLIPEELVQQFRTVAQQRLERVETAWTTVLTSLDDEAANLIHREIHTLKGESRMLGFTDVNLVCHKLEDLLEVARVRGYAVDEDFDLVVNMALRFMAMLVRKKVGAQLQGIDLPGFIAQIDKLLAEIKPRPSRAITGVQVALRRDSRMPRVPVAIRSRLAPIAIDAFVEYAAARGVRRDRLRASWHALRDLIGTQRAVIGAGQLAKHRTNALGIARDLGKEVDVTFEIESAEVTTEMLAALDAAVLHLVRNAVDHGIESPVDRAVAGKPTAGRIAVRCGLNDGSLVLSIADDGRGVAIEEVLARAIDLGLVSPNATDASERWFDLVCQPGFSTRTEASDVSGRGAGLDAVRSAITDVGGTLTATTADGAGTTWTISIPVPQVTITGQVFRAPGVPFPIVIEESWQPASDNGTPPIDLALRLGLVDEPTSGTPRYVTNGTDTIGIVSTHAPSATSARRLVAVPPPSFAEIATLDTVEGLLIHPDRLR